MWLPLLLACASASPVDVPPRVTVGPAADRPVPIAGDAPATVDPPAPVAPPAPVDPPSPAWRTLAPGLEFAEIALAPTDVGDGLARVVRVDPATWTLDLLMASAGDGAPHTPSDWLARSGAVAAINPSMFADDQSSSVGWMSTRQHVNSTTWAPRQRSLLFADPNGRGLPRFGIANLGCDARADVEAHHALRVQSIRMLGCDGETVWAEDSRRWSASVIGMDRAGRALLIHVRSPYSMHTLATLLAAAPLDLVALHYGDGGPPAAMAVRTPALTRAWIGSYETGVYASDGNRLELPVPNVLVVRALQGRRAAGAGRKKPAIRGRRRVSGGGGLGQS